MTPEERIAHLEGELKAVRDEAAAKWVSNRDLLSENNKLKGDVATLTRERDDAVGKVGKPSELQAKIDGLTGQLRQMKHQRSFEKLANAAGVKPKAITTLWNDLKLQADSDEPDEKVLQSALDGAKETHDFAFDLDPPASETTTPPLPPALGGDRGGAAGAKFVLTPELRRNARWMADNDTLIRRHEAAGTLVRK